MLTYQDILSGAQRLSAAEKARLLAEISAELRAELSDTQQAKRSLSGL